MRAKSPRTYPIGIHSAAAAPHAARDLSPKSWRQRWTAYGLILALGGAWSPGVLAQASGQPVEGVQTPIVALDPPPEPSNVAAVRGGFVVPMIATIAIILGILAATNSDDDDRPQPTGTGTTGTQ